MCTMQVSCYLFAITPEVPLSGGADESSLCYHHAAYFFQWPVASNRQMGLQ